MTTALETYIARMQRVLDYIDRHLDEELDLDTISGVAAFSKFHFHRQFSATFGVSVHRYVQLARMKRASLQLTAAGSPRVTDIAMDAGYEAPEAFARAFRQRLGQSPSAFQKDPDWASWLVAFGPLQHARNALMQVIYTHDDVVIRDVEETPVAVFEHRGDPETLPASIERFVAWRKAAGLSPDKNPTFNVFRSERRPANPAEYSMDLCVGTDIAIDPNDPDMKAGTIPAGRCAVLRVVHHTHNLEAPAMFLYRDWLPASGEEAADFPVYCRRYFSLFAGSDVQDVVCELYLPLK